MSNNKINTVSIYTPSTLNFNELFGKMKAKDQERIRFLIYHINYWTNKSGASRTSREDMKGFLSVAPAKVTSLYNLLIIEKLIYQSEEAVSYKDKNKKGKNAGYSMVIPFDQEDPTQFVEYIYDLSADNTPDFILHWNNCHKVVKPLIKEKKPKTVKKPTMKQLQAQLEHALSFIAASGLDYKPLDTSDKKYCGATHKGSFAGLTMAQIQAEQAPSTTSKVVTEQLAKPLKTVDYTPSNEVKTIENVKVFPKTKNYPAMTIYNYLLVNNEVTEDELREEIEAANVGSDTIYSLGLNVMKTENINDFSIVATLSR
jgi:hypothetical protein